MADSGRRGYRPVKHTGADATDRGANDIRRTADSRRSAAASGLTGSDGIRRTPVRTPNASGSRSTLNNQNQIMQKPNAAGARITKNASAGRGRKSDPRQSDVLRRTEEGHGAVPAESAERGMRQKGGPLSVFRRKTPEMLRREEEEWNAGVIRTRGGIDRVFLALVIALLCMGTIMVFSASYPYALSKKGDGYFYIKKQIIFAVLGVAAMIGTSFIPYRLYRDLSWAIYAVCCILLVAVLLMGLIGGGAKRWLGVPGTSLTLQPSELMKAGLPIMLAWYYDKYKDKVRSRDSLGKSFIFSIGIPLLFVIFACGLVLMEKHLSGTLIIAAIGFSVMFLGGAHLGLLAGCGAGFLGAAAIYVLNNSYAMQRIITLQGESADDLADRWQVSQGLNAIGNGGLMGVGLGQSVQKNSYVSQAQNDFIFTIWCEEMGYVGAVFVILIFVALIWRGYSIARKAPDTFSSLVVFGIVSQVGIQALLNMCVVTELIPNTGISLPFFSYGGTSLVVLLAEMGIILSVSRQSYLRK